MTIKAYSLASFSAATPGPGPLLDCPKGSWWNPTTGRCEQQFVPTRYNPQEPVPDLQPVDPYADQPVDPHTEPPPPPAPASSSKKWLVVGGVALVALVVFMRR